jgi:hypothetical protein
VEITVVVMVVHIVMESKYHQRLFLEAWLSIKDPNAGNDHTIIIIIPEVYNTRSSSISIFFILKMGA